MITKFTIWGLENVYIYIIYVVNQYHTKSATSAKISMIKM